jgi:hypothetical protein
MKRKSLFLLGFCLLVTMVVALIVFLPLLRVYVARIRMHEPLFPPGLPTTNSTGPTDGYGVYESCSPNDENTCLNHLNTMAAAGFKLVINYSQLDGDKNFQEAYFDRAQSLGMKVIFPLKDPAFYNGKDLRSEFPALAQTCNCSSNSGFIDYVVHLVKGYPSLWGYYVGDEVDPADHNDMKAKLADAVQQLDPNHPRLFIDNAGQAVAVWHGNSPFYDTAEVIGSDFYPIRDDSPQYPTIDQAGEVAAGVQAYADAHKEGSAIVLQAFSYTNYNIPGTPYPTADQMKSMLSQVLAHSRPRIILWYSYYDTMSSGPASTQHWNTLKSLIAHPVG